jgi:nucleotide-binding universal stress UspA family protein/multisubunit Na+/H+ antiporter MnhG subunit
VTLEAVLGAVGAVFLVMGCVLATIGLYGVLVKPDIFDQLHVAGLVTGPGVVLVLLASIGAGSAEIVTSAFLVGAFVLVTSSISTHVIAHAGVRRYGPGVAQATPVEGISAATSTAGAATAAGSRTAPDDRPPGGMRVVVAYDGSAPADVAADIAASIDWPAGTSIHVVGAIANDGVEVEASLRRAAAAMERPGIHIETTVSVGDPADVVVNETASFDTDLLITGSRRRSVVQSALGWSAAGDIVDRSPCPVLVARTRTLRSVMLTTDGSLQSDAAADVVARWPIFDLTTVRIATVAMDRSPAPEDQRAVDRAAAQLMDAGREIVTEVLQGRPGPAIVDAARGWAVDLIVIGSRGRTGLGRTLLGSVAGEVLASAPCSVLIVGPPPRRPRMPN